MSEALVFLAGVACGVVACMIAYGFYAWLAFTLEREESDDGEGR